MNFTIGCLIAFLTVLLHGAVAAAYEKRPLCEGEERRHHPIQRGVMWMLAVLVEKWQGLSLTRFLAIGIFFGTLDVAHDLLELCAPKVDAATKMTVALTVPAPYVFLVLGGFLLSVVAALGAKHVDKLIEVAGDAMAARLGRPKPAPAGGAA